jgi:hypothetical protein
MKVSLANILRIASSACPTHPAVLQRGAESILRKLYLINSMTADGFDSGSILAGSPQRSTPRPYNFGISLPERRSFPRRLGRASPIHLEFLLPVSLPDD